MRAHVFLLLSACLAEGPIDRPLPPPGSLTLTAPTLLTDAEATFTVDGAGPGDTVWMLGSSTPARTGSCPAATAPLCLDIGGRLRVLGSAVADSAGTAHIAVPMPAGTAGRAVAGQAVVLSTSSSSNRIDRTLVDVDPTFVGDVCQLDEQTTVRPAVRELFGPTVGGAMFPGFSSWGLGTHVLTDAVAYQDFQTDQGMTLPAVDFSTHDVLAVTYSVSSTCGVDIDGYDVFLDPATRDVVLQADVFDASRNCPLVCSAVGWTALVVEVPRSTAPEICIDFVGGCAAP